MVDPRVLDADAAHPTRRFCAVRVQPEVWGELGAALQHRCTLAENLRRTLELRQRQRAAGHGFRVLSMTPEARLGFYPIAALERQRLNLLRNLA